MISLFLNNIGRFILLVIIQVLVLNNIQFIGFSNPYLYILFILLLPFETPGWLLLLVSFFLGLSVDMFSNTFGLHASASVFLAFLRPYVLVLFSPREGYDPGASPKAFSMGFVWFAKYSVILIFSHHIFLFFIEAFNYSDIRTILLRTIASTVLTFVLVVLSQFFMHRK